MAVSAPRLVFFSRHRQCLFSPLLSISLNYSTLRKKTHTATKRPPISSSDEEKRRTRSKIEFDWRQQHYYNLDGGHIPVLLGEVLQVFDSRVPLRSFVDCTLGAAGHSSAIIQAHSEMEIYVGLDVDPLAHEKAETLMNIVLDKELGGKASEDLQVYTFQKNFKDIKSALGEVDEKLLVHGVDGILMDLGVSSMQVSNAERGFSVLNDGPLDMRMNPKVSAATSVFLYINLQCGKWSIIDDKRTGARSYLGRGTDEESALKLLSQVLRAEASLKAEDILNSWPEAEVGRILRDYGEESDWHRLQNKIVNARSYGGLHSTGELVDLVQSMSPMSKGRKGWVKTATRVFQALRIAVNDELRTLEHALSACFDCLSFGGRLAVISFHSLEDRIVKKMFLDLVNVSDGDAGEERSRVLQLDNDGSEEETWVKKSINGTNGIILTKRPITPSEEEERLNQRCRSAKLRVVQKMRRQ
ncbi:hypothetical protein IFM89_015366 [Coptis chinensis]|uniref:Ribosomal RNA small subunit methyltransferase H n=1 Tax=Coptis chinensis TaxID=261450 RepID=A0A835IC37_9MAGN|nr:hypothetical protein IFM89_015366 [Coptis chinensis]